MITVKEIFKETQQTKKRTNLKPDFLLVTTNVVNQILYRKHLQSMKYMISNNSFFNNRAGQEKDKF